MKLIFAILLSVAVFFTLQAVIPTKEEMKIYDTTLRLHVIANSDSEEDQELKLKVRDAILARVGEYDLESKEDALKTIEGSVDELVGIAQTVIKNEGYDYDVDIEIGQEMYFTRYYDDFALPAGEYTSVRVKIGQGVGQNWWCVLYPPLCTEVAIEGDKEETVEVGLTKDQYDLITSNEKGEYKIKFKILEMASYVFGFEY